MLIFFLFFFSNSLNTCLVEVLNLVFAGELVTLEANDFFLEKFYF